MYIRYPLGFMHYKWDPAKNASNILKHRIDFAEAEEIFDKGVFSYLDTRHDYEEIRWVAVGLLRGAVVALAFSERNESTRIISIREASRHEANYYYKKVSDQL